MASRIAYITQIAIIVRRGRWGDAYHLFTDSESLLQIRKLASMKSVCPQTISQVVQARGKLRGFRWRELQSVLIAFNGQFEIRDISFLSIAVFQRFSQFVHARKQTRIIRQGEEDGLANEVECLVQIVEVGCVTRANKQDLPKIGKHIYRRRLFGGNMLECELEVVYSLVQIFKLSFRQVPLEVASSTAIEELSTKSGIRGGKTGIL